MLIFVSGWERAFAMLAEGGLRVQRSWPTNILQAATVLRDCAMTIFRARYRDPPWAPVRFLNERAEQ